MMYHNWEFIMKKIILISIVAIISILFSCEDSKSPVITDTKPGNITGVLDIYESDDNSGAYVSIKGTKYVTTTDYAGRWTLTNVEPGVYDIIFSKPGYDTTEIYGFQFAGNGTAYCNFNEYRWATQVDNYPASKWAIFAQNSTIVQNIETQAKDRLDSNDIKFKVLSISGKLSQDENLLFFFGKDINVSNLNYLNIITNGWDRDRWYSYNNKDNTFQFEIDFRLFKDMYYVSGEKIYFIVYPGHNIIETDLRNGKKRMCWLGKPSNVVEFVVP